MSPTGKPATRRDETSVRPICPPAPLLLLLTLTVPVSGCADDPSAQGVTSLLVTIGSELRAFPEVFPTNYYVSHRYNGSLLCDKDPCCVFQAAVVLKDSWSRLLVHLPAVHLKQNFVLQLTHMLLTLTDPKIQGNKDLSSFPHVHSTPEELLHYTHSVLARWLKLDCPSGAGGCAFPTAAAIQGDAGVDEEAGGEFAGRREAERGKRWSSVFHVPTNAGMVRFHFPGLPLWTVSLLWTTLDAIVRRP
ncbi:uncharacterized protein LOC114790804 [Denticeps clupeoides]|uniref:Uncharacterized protein n=1 Tax=Denticeps clupeoides TaxID=299321 RepID=A0AAY4A2E4_9TELE|nr:uncharacterized protein LOC114790804 [Denticeps clupeoides]